MSSRATTVFTVAGVTVLGGLLAYAVYFDYKRRNDAEFRRKLRKEKKKANKNAPATQPSAGGPSAGPAVITAEELKSSLAKIRAEDLPATSEEKEQYFMQQVGLGEQLALQGPAFQLPAAMCFFRALRVYPSPVELIMIYQKTVPEPVFKLVMELTNLDVVARASGYYDTFPPKDMNVSVKEIEVPGQPKKKVLVVEKDFEAGDVIYKEEPIVAALDVDLQGQGTYCTYCLRHIQSEEVIKPESDRIHSVYCSKECQVKSKAQSDNLLFGLDPVLPAEMDNGLNNLTKDARDAAQTKLVEHLNSKGKIAPLLAARLVARQIAAETAKMIPGKTGPSPTDFPEALTSSDFSLFDHLERLRFVQATVTEDDTKLISDVFENGLQGLGQAFDAERNATFQGQIAYNAYGIFYGEGRTDKPASTERPEDQGRTRTPYGTSRQVGTGLYLVSSYIQHSCDPSARPEFKDGNSELYLIATRSLKKGDELTVSYVDSSVHPDETPDQARRRRRIEIARGWRFKCECPRCTAEMSAAPADAESDVELSKDDESKVVAAVERFERGETPASGSDAPAGLATVVEVPTAPEPEPATAEETTELVAEVLAEAAAEAGVLVHDDNGPSVTEAVAEVAHVVDVPPVTDAAVVEAALEAPVEIVVAPQVVEAVVAEATEAPVEIVAAEEAPVETDGAEPVETPLEAAEPIEVAHEEVPSVPEAVAEVAAVAEPTESEVVPEVEAVVVDTPAEPEAAPVVEAEAVHVEATPEPVIVHDA
ncbi:hypothetical protein C8Q75DRAFT_214382 [Abortiporus biennis]|nr:hypothetical protein C8Q75DRAFT_214382 [Abortiporus biennis]